mgnify:CR=1 FL=1
MEIQVHERPDGSYFVRGVVSEMRAALVELPGKYLREEVEAVARPLLVAKFARGEWYVIGDSSTLTVTVYKDGQKKYDPADCPREVIVVE